MATNTVETIEVDEQSEQPTNSSTGGESKQPEIPGVLVGHFRALIKVARALTKAEHHIEVLTTNLHRENPPAGLTPRIRPQVPNPSVNFLIEWQDKLQNLGLELTKQLIQFWQDRAKSLLNDYKELERVIKSRSQSEEWETIRQIVEEKQRETTQELKRKKQKPTRAVSRVPVRKAVDSRDQAQS